MNFVLTSASEALITSFTGALSASLIFISVPSRAFAVSIDPSTWMHRCSEKQSKGAGAQHFR
jgi:hypothetical protein